MNTFTKWFLVNSVVATAAFFAETKGALSTMIKNDVSHLTIVIMILYVLLTAFVGKLCYLADKADKKKAKHDLSELSRRSEIGWFAAEHFFSLGLLGTIIGLIIATGGSLDSALPLTEIVAGLKEGLNTAFYTTVCGIVFSLPLQGQLMILRFKLEG